MTASDPVVAQIQLGILLRDLRERADLSGTEAAPHISKTNASLSRIENGKQSISVEDVAALVDLYGASDADTAEALRLASVPKPKARRRRSASYRDAVPNWFRRFLALESEATEITMYENDFITGLFQTEDYARVLLRAGAPLAGKADLDKQVEMRTARTEILNRDDPARLDVILHESTLRRVVGDDAVMRAQLAHLREMSERPNIDLRILPFRPRATRNYDEAFSPRTPFTLLKLPDRGTVLYVEDIAGATYPEDLTLIQQYAAGYERLRSAASDEEASRKLIAKVAAEYE